eukprot:10127004-Alexandrium_andersonii.AAC.1
MAHGFWIVAGSGARPDCRIRDYSRTWEDLYQARVPRGLAEVPRAPPADPESARNVAQTAPRRGASGTTFEAALGPARLKL